MLVSGLSLLLQFALVPISLAFLGAENYGLWTAVSAIVLFGAIGNQGFMDSLTRHVAIEYEPTTQDFGQTHGYLVASILLAMIWISTLTIAIYLLISPISSFIAPPPYLSSLTDDLLLGLVLVPSLVLTESLLSALLGGLGRVDLVNWNLLLAGITRFLSVVVLLSIGWGVWALYVGLLVSHCTSILLNLYRLSSLGIFRDLNPRCSHAHIIELFRMSSWIFLSRIINLAVGPSLRLIISRYVGLTETGYFSIGYRAVFAIRSIIASTMKAYLPHASSIEGAKDFAGTLGLIRQSTMVLCGGVTILFTLLAIFDEVLLKVWLGSAYDHSVHDVFGILLIAYGVNMVALPLTTSSISWGRSNYLFIATCVLALTLYCVLYYSYLLDEKLSLVDVAIAYASAIVASATTSSWLAIRELKRKASDHHETL